LSTLTKVLVILLTVSSIFLCGIVVTYVGHAENYKQLYDEMKTKAQLAINAKNAAQKELQDKKEEFQAREDQLTAKIASLQKEVTNLSSEVKNLKRELALQKETAEHWASFAKELTATNTNQQQLLEQKLNELKQVKAEQIKQAKELAETSETLMAKMAIIQNLEAQNKRLEEEKAQLQKQLDQLLAKQGRQVMPVEPVTPEPTRVKPVSTFTKPIGLQGTILALDIPNSVAQISIGSANGVKEGMKFFVTRGDQFICELLIVDVEPDSAVGVLQRVRQSLLPKTGDNVTTNL